MMKKLFKQQEFFILIILLVVSSIITIINPKFFNNCLSQHRVALERNAVYNERVQEVRELDILAVL